MVQLFAFRRSLRLVALALCSAAIAALRSLRLRRDLITAQGGTVTSITPRWHHRSSSAHRYYRHSRTRSRWDDGVAQMQARGFAMPMPAPARSPAAAMTSSARVRLIRRRRRGAALYRRQSHRPRQPVVREIHEHGAGAFRSSRHRLGYGALVRELWPARIRPADRRHRRDGAARRRPCRGGQRHRTPDGNPIVVSGNNGNRVREAVCRAAGSTPTSCRPSLMRLRAAHSSCGASAVSHRRRQWCRRRSLRHRPRNRRGRGGASASAEY